MRVGFGLLTSRPVRIHDALLRGRVFVHLLGLLVDHVVLVHGRIVLDAQATPQRI